MRAPESLVVEEVEDDPDQEGADDGEDDDGICLDFLSLEIQVHDDVVEPAFKLADLRNMWGRDDLPAAVTRVVKKPAPKKRSIRGSPIEVKTRKKEPPRNPPTSDADDDSDNIAFLFDSADHFNNAMTVTRDMLDSAAAARGVGGNFRAKVVFVEDDADRVFTFYKRGKSYFCKAGDSMDELNFVAELKQMFDDLEKRGLERNDIIEELTADETAC